MPTRPVLLWRARTEHADKAGALLWRAWMEHPDQARVGGRVAPEERRVFRHAGRRAAAVDTNRYGAYARAGQHRHCAAREAGDIPLRPMKQGRCSSAAFILRMPQCSCDALAPSTPAVSAPG